MELTYRCGFLLLYACLFRKMHSASYRAGFEFLCFFFISPFSPSISVVFIQCSWNYFLSGSELPCPPPSFSGPPPPSLPQLWNLLGNQFCTTTTPLLATHRHKILSQKKTTCHVWNQVQTQENLLLPNPLARSGHDVLICRVPCPCVVRDQVK